MGYGAMGPIEERIPGLGTDSMDVVIPGSLELRIPEDKAALKIQSIHRGKRDRAKVTEAPGAQRSVLVCSFVSRGCFGAEFWRAKRSNY